MAGFTNFVELAIATNQGEDTGKTIWANVTQIESMQAMDGSHGQFTEVVFASGKQLAVTKDPSAIMGPIGGR